jgi:mycothiol synthase
MRSLAADSAPSRHAPPIPGVAFRGYRGPGDAIHVARVNNAARDADGIDDIVTAEEIANDYAAPTNCDPARDIVLAEVDGLVVGYSRVWWVDTNDGARSYISFCAVDPRFRRRGLGRYLLLATETRRRAIAARHEFSGARWLEAFIKGTDPGGRALVTELGYEPARDFLDMLRPDLDDLPEAVLPAGLEVRPATNEHARQVFDADAEAFRDHWGWVDNSDEEFERFVADPMFDPSLWQIAWDGDDVAGLVINAINREENELRGYRRGILHSVAVRRSWRRRGLARALVVRSLRALRDRGMTSATLGVDAENPQGALHLYESVGFQVSARSTAYRKPLD